MTGVRSTLVQLHRRDVVFRSDAPTSIVGRGLDIVAGAGASCDPMHRLSGGTSQDVTVRRRARRGRLAAADEVLVFQRLQWSDA